MGRLVKDIMTNEVVWVHPEQSLFEALSLMRQFDIRHLPVIEQQSNKLIGLLSEGDIILFCQKRGEKLEVDSQIHIHEAMSKDVVYCFPLSKPTSVAATMIVAKIDSLPVLDPETKQILGIVTTTDLLDEMCVNEELNGESVWPFKYNNPNKRMKTPLHKQSS